MKNFWSIFVLVFFINFIALPSIASVFGIELPQTNISISGEEEEQHHTPIKISPEKVLPKVLCVIDFLSKNGLYQPTNGHFEFLNSTPISPLLSIFSPPPEEKI